MINNIIDPVTGGGSVNRTIQVAEAIVKYYRTECVILSTDKGKVIRFAVKEIRIAGRNTQGVRIIKTSGEEKVVSAIKIEDNFN